MRIFKKIYHTLLNKIVSNIGKKVLPQYFNGPFKELKRIPRYTVSEVNLFDKKIKIADSASFLFMYREMFEREIYKFRSKNNPPYIIDCGSNIGLSVIYFKRCFPGAKIVAFEADEEIFKILKNNIKSFEYKNIGLIQKAVWNKAGYVEFYSDGADGGRITPNQDARRKERVATVRLSSYLNEPVDLLKLDIEGSEVEVLRDCANQLNTVDKIFVEYHSLAGQPQQLSELLEILQKANFKYYVESVCKISTQPLYEQKTVSGYDMLLNIYAYRK